MHSISLISLTPDFSQVSEAPWTTEPFQRFAGKEEAVETADNSLGSLSTWLKPGVNERGAFPRSSAV
jgi:hypothetical protein